MNNVLCPFARWFGAIIAVLLVGCAHVTSNLCEWLVHALIGTRKKMLKISASMVFHLGVRNTLLPTQNV